MQDHHGEHPGGWWRSHTFMDGTREIVLSVRVGPVVAGALHARLSELTAHGCDRLVLDVTASGTLERDELGLLAGALAGQPPDCRIALVVAQEMLADEALGEHVCVATSLSSARRMLQLPASSRGRAPAGPLLPPDRHALAARQSLRWAALAAAEGDFDSALSWLATVEDATGSLSAEWRRRRQAWTLAHHGRAAAYRRPSRR
ncbi:MAG TPA: hypothetical protein VFV85_10290 [Conexibacter sp.]|nr:hypothetical protein [Conexibacter sp.]